MNLLRSLARALGGTSNSGDAAGMYFYVRCARCGEVIRVRINRMNDLSVQYNENGSKGDTFFVRKVIVGKRCYNRIEADFTFDSSRRLVDKQITGGTFAEESDYRGPAENS